MTSEAQVLRLSITVTLLLALAGIVFGLLAGSSAILFDGIYELADAVMTGFALLVAKLIAASHAAGPERSKLNQRFTMGFWHLEPMVLGLNGVLLIGASAYALLNALSSFLTGGRLISFDYALVYAAISLTAELTTGLFVLRANRTIGSSLLALDARSWLMSAAMTVALIVAFAFGALAGGTRLEWVTPYVDPAILAIVCLVLIPMPFGTVRHALKDILLVTPKDLMAHVDDVAAQIVDRYGFSSYRAYVAKVGRGEQIELYFIVPPAWPAKTIEEWDRLRDEINDELGEDTPDRWLTIVFTADPEWAD